MVTAEQEQAPLRVSKGLAEIELRVALTVGLTTVLKVVFRGEPLELAGDAVFLVGLALVGTERGLLMLLLAAAAALPNGAGISKFLGGPYCLELVAFALCGRMAVRHGWRTLGRAPAGPLPYLAVYALLLFASVLNSSELVNHLITARYLVLLLIVALGVSTYARGEGVRAADLEEVLFRALRAALIAYVLIFLAQFTAPDAYDAVFYSSDGVREGTRVGYPVYTALGVLVLSLLQVGVDRRGQQEQSALYRRLRPAPWIALGLFAIFGTGSRLPLLQVLALSLLLLRSTRAVVTVVGVVSAGVAIAQVPALAVVLERLAGIASLDRFVNNLAIRMLPAWPAVESMHGLELFFGKGLDYRFFVPWFDLRADDFDAYSTFIDQLWLTVFVQAGVLGCALVALLFLAGAAFLRRHARVLRQMPATRYLVLFLLCYVHGFFNIAYARDIYVFVGFLAGLGGALRREARARAAASPRQPAPGLRVPIRRV